MSNEESPMPLRVPQWRGLVKFPEAVDGQASEMAPARERVGRALGGQEGVCNNPLPTSPGVPEQERCRRCLTAFYKCTCVRSEGDLSVSQNVLIKLNNGVSLCIR